MWFCHLLVYICILMYTVVERGEEFNALQVNFGVAGERFLFRCCAEQRKIEQYQKKLQGWGCCFTKNSNT